MTKLTKLLEKHNCIHKNSNFSLSSGKTSSIYYDVKKAAGIPDLLELITNSLVEIIPKNASIVGVSTGGVPFAAITACKLKSNFAYVRNVNKKYGLEKSIEGLINPSQEIFIIDDVCTTGKSLVSAKNKILEVYPNSKIKLVSIINRKENNLDVLSLEEI